MQVNKYILLLLLLLFILVVTSCTNVKNNIIDNTLDGRDTIYILFKENIHKMEKFKALQYDDQDPKYYKITYDIPVYWKQEVTKSFAEKEYGKDYIKKYGIREQDYFLFDDYYNYNFWFGTHKIIQGYEEFDDSKIYGNSAIIKKHKSFLKDKKKMIIDHNWLKNKTPPKVWEILKPYKETGEKPVLFIIDQSEYTKDSIILRNVIYHQEVIE